MVLQATPDKTTLPCCKGQHNRTHHVTHCLLCSPRGNMEHTRAAYLSKTPNSSDLPRMPLLQSLPSWQQHWHRLSNQANRRNEVLC